MSFKQPVPQRRGVHYKKVEAPVFYEMENNLCRELGLTYSELHKRAVRKLNNDRLSALTPELVF